MHRLSPHLLALGVLPADPPVAETVPASKLMSPLRFDLAFKHIFAQHYLHKGASSYPVQQYAEHIRVITNGSFREDDGSKKGLQDYLASFERLLDSMRNGFDDTRSVIPVDRNYTALDGAHRIAGAMALGLNVPILRFSHQAPSYDAKAFAAMPTAMITRGALELVKLCSDLRLMVAFHGADETLVSPHVTVEFSHTIHVDSPVAQAPLIRELYLGESWLGGSENGYPGAAPKARECFKNGPTVRLLIVRGDVVSAKKAIRARDGGKHDLVHATDTQGETVRVARCLLHEPSVQFLNRPHVHLPRFEGLLAEYRSTLGGIDQDVLCVDGSAVLAEYGLREPADLDFVHAVPVPVSGRISSHNAYSMLYPFQKDELIWNPACYFWSRGIKFASLDSVRRVKTHIVDDKNIADLKLMEGL